MATRLGLLGLLGLRYLTRVSNAPGSGEFINVPFFPVFGVGARIGEHNIRRRAQREGVAVTRY